MRTSIRARSRNSSTSMPSYDCRPRVERSDIWLRLIDPISHICHLIGLPLLYLHHPMAVPPSLHQQLTRYYIYSLREPSLSRRQHLISPLFFPLLNGPEFRDTRASSPQAGSASRQSISFQGTNLCFSLPLMIPIGEQKAGAGFAYHGGFSISTDSGDISGKLDRT